MSFGVYRKRIRNIVYKIYTSFWLESEDETIKIKLEKYFKIMKKIGIAYVLIIVFISCIFLTEPSFRIPQDHPFSLWMPNRKLFFESPYYEMMYGLQITLFVFMVFCGVIMSNVFFGLAVGFVVMQFDLLTLKLASLSRIKDRKNVFNLLKICIDHHNILLE